MTSPLQYPSPDDLRIERALAGTLEVQLLHLLKERVMNDPRGKGRGLVPGTRHNLSQSSKAYSQGTEDIDNTIAAALGAGDLDGVMADASRSTRRTIQSRLRARGWGTPKQQGR